MFVRSRINPGLVRLFLSLCTYFKIINNILNLVLILNEAPNMQCLGKKQAADTCMNSHESKQAADTCMNSHESKQAADTCMNSHESKQAADTCMNSHESKQAADTCMNSSCHESEQCCHKNKHAKLSSRCLKACRELMLVYTVAEIQAVVQKIQAVVC